MNSNAASDSKRPGLIVRVWRGARTVARDPAGTASLIALLLGVIVSVLPVHGQGGIGIHSVGYAVVGAAVFSFMYQFWANDALVQTIESNIGSAQERALREIKHAWNEAVTTASTTFSQYSRDVLLMHKRHWPLDIYPEGNTPNPAFNEQLESDLGAASRYDFRGQSGKHLASRLLIGRYPRLESLRIVVEDATVPDVMNARIYEKRFSAPEQFGSMSAERLSEIVLDDFLDSIIGLFLACAQFDSIELVYARRPTDVRVEITDGVVYISPYIRNRPAGNRYPEVFRYDPRSLPAEVAKLEFNREFGLLSDNKLVLRPSTSHDVLLEHVRSKGWQMSTEAFRQRYHAAEGSLRTLGGEMGGTQTP
jgi:hypothetical protein